MRTGADSVASPTFLELQRELPVYSPRAWRFGAMAATSRAGALLSRGLRIGHEHGFDSGPFMAHVYENDPRGRTAVGRAIDRRLLERRTCQAFREIRELARNAIDAALDADESGAPVVADLAAGPAPYLFEALLAHPSATATLVDIDEAALDQARIAAARLGVGDRAHFLKGSAFDQNLLARLEPSPTIIVELGLYGIYHDDALIERHFQDIAKIVEPEQLVFNVQTQNPEIERIARVWRDHRGQRCLWRLRPPQRILDWAAAAGFQPLSLESDSHGIYRVGRLGRTAEVSG